MDDTIGPAYYKFVYFLLVEFIVIARVLAVMLLKDKLVLAVRFTPPLHWDGGTARTTIHVHAVNLIELS